MGYSHGYFSSIVYHLFSIIYQLLLITYPLSFALLFPILLSLYKTADGFYWCLTAQPTLCGIYFPRLSATQIEGIIGTVDLTFDYPVYLIDTRFQNYGMYIRRLQRHVHQGIAVLEVRDTVGAELYPLRDVGGGKFDGGLFIACLCQVQTGGT